MSYGGRNSRDGTIENVFGFESRKPAYLETQHDVVYGILFEFDTQEPKAGETTWYARRLKKYAFEAAEYVYNLTLAYNQNTVNPKHLEL